jgi:hypothetical protein
MTRSEIKSLKKKLHMVRIALLIRSGRKPGKIYHVKYVDDFWTVKLEGAKKCSNKFYYKDEAVGQAKHLAKGLKFGQVFTYKKDDSPHNAHTYIDAYKREKEAKKKREAAERRRYQYRRRIWGFC